MTPLDRLLAETIPTRPPPHQPTHHPHHTWTPAEQDAHWQTLCNAVGTPGEPRPPQPDTQPHTPRRTT